MNHAPTSAHAPARRHPSASGDIGATRKSQNRQLGNNVFDSDILLA